MLAVALLLAAGTSTNCDAIRTMSSPQTIVMSADVVPAGVFVPPPPPAARAGVAPAAAAGGAPGARDPIPQHCRGKLTPKPTPDSNIYSELGLPAHNRNRKPPAHRQGG